MRNIIKLLLTNRESLLTVIKMWLLVLDYQSQERHRNARSLKSKSKFLEIESTYIIIELRDIICETIHITVKGGGGRSCNYVKPSYVMNMKDQISSIRNSSSSVIMITLNSSTPLDNLSIVNIWWVPWSSGGYWNLDLARTVSVTSPIASYSF